MQDNEIIKALECCGKHICKGCPYDENADDLDIGCIIKLSKDALILINHQQEELAHAVETICKQKEEIDRLERDYSVAVESMSNSIRNIGQKDVKEFADRLHNLIEDFRNKREMPMLPYTAAALDFVDRKIENIKKEMVGED